jgi:hypothetical protein
MRTHVAVSLVLVFALGVTADALAQNKCAGAKIKAACKKQKCLLGLEAKACQTGVAADPARVQKCIDKFESTFAKLEAKGGCLTSNDVVATEAKIDAFVADVDSELCVAPAGDAGVCAAAKIRASARKACCLLGLEAKEAAKGVPVDPIKAQRCGDKHSSAFTKADAKDGCATIGDAAVQEAKVDAFVVDADAELSAAPTTTITTSTIVTTTTDVTSTTSSTTTTSTTEPSTSTTETSTTSTTSSTTTSTTSTTTTTMVTTTTCPLPATGQTTCWNSSGMVIACAGTGHDGDLQTGAPLSYTDNGDGTITDNNTGLVWEKKSDDGSLNDKDTLYTWSDAFGHVANLSASSFAGHNDWRLPNVRELESIVHYESASAVSSVFSSGCAPGCAVSTCSCNPTTAWSSTSGVSATDRAWRAQSGVLSVALKGNTQSVRAVRAGGPCLPATGQTTCWNSVGTVVPCAGTGQDGELQAGSSLSYTDNGDGTITDNNTGLVWEKKSDDGSLNDVDTTYSWTNAFAVHVAGLNAANFAGYTDWRLPNARELQSLVNYQNVPTVDPAFNTACSSGCTVLTCSCTRGNEAWSSSSASPAPADAWWASFLFGNVTFSPKGTALRVRAVRGGS